MIRLNGFVTVNNDEIYFEDFEIEIDEDLDLPFDYLTDDEEEYCNCCNDDCEDCEFYEGEDEEGEVNIDEIVDELTTLYADILSEDFCCAECTKKILTDLIRDFIDCL